MQMSRSDQSRLEEVTSPNREYIDRPETMCHCSVFVSLRSAGSPKKAMCVRVGKENSPMNRDNISLSVGKGREDHCRGKKRNRCGVPGIDGNKLRC